MHHFRMRPFKPIWGWTKNTSSSPAQGFFITSLPQNFPLLPTPPHSYLPHPSYFLHLISHSFHLQSSEELSSLSSKEPLRRCRHKVWRRWKSLALKECGEEKVRGALHPKYKSERINEALSLLCIFFSFLWFYFFVCFFSFLLFEKKKMLRESAWNERVKARGQKQEPKMKGQRRSLKVSSLPSLHFFSQWIFFLCVFFLFFCLRIRRC